MDCEKAKRIKLDTNDELAEVNCIQDNDNRIPVDCKLKFLQELDVGISEYISKHNGFSAVIKQRYSDFLVNEVSLSNEVVRLTKTSYQDFNNQEPVIDSPSSTDNILETTGWKKIIDESRTKLGKDAECYFKLSEYGAHDDKNMRGRLHKAIRYTYPDMESETKTENEQTQIVVRMSRSGGQKRRAVPGSEEHWPKAGGNYLQFVLYKENMDTMDAINTIAKYTRIKPQTFSYAGTKDRRAKTSQLIHAYRVPQKKIHGLNSKLRNMVTGNYRYIDVPLKLGDLIGNHFEIVLRNVTGATTDTIDRALNLLKLHGFINYFGMQRFGTTAIPTYHVGRALIEENWYEAIELILKPREGDYGNISKARKTWSETHDANKALAALGHIACNERYLLQGLQQHHDKDYINALAKLPRNVRLMYLHSFQSYVWNRVVSQRIKQHGLAVLPGDLVATTSIWIKDIEKTPPKSISADDLDKYTINDVVMPLPGYDVQYPENNTSKLYIDIMAELKLEPSCWKCSNKDYSLPGAYRRMVVKPRHLDWHTTTYTDMTVPLTLSDYDKILGSSLAKAIEGDKQALVLGFSLPSSCFATMAIREVLKQDTSPSHQTTLNSSIE